MSDEINDQGSRKIGNLRMIWRFALNYPLHIAAAFAFLIVAAGASLGIPWGFKQIIDNGFASGGSNIAVWFEKLLGVVVVLSVATAARFYFVSWVGERVVADIRIAVQRNLVRL